MRNTSATRREQTGERSDTIMVAHIDPDTETGLLVSFPRDLWVEIPGRGEAKLNSAFNDGPQVVVETITQNFGIPINHYLEIDFAGFRNLVNAIGTVPIYFPTPARDFQTGLAIDAAGCHRLDGETALKYARSREYEYVGEDGDWEKDGTADLGRIRRQQYFIRSLANEAVKSGFRNPLKIPDMHRQDGGQPHARPRSRSLGPERAREHVPRGRSRRRGDGDGADGA